MVRSITKDTVLCMSLAGRPRLLVNATPVGMSGGPTDDQVRRAAELSRSTTPGRVAPG